MATLPPQATTEGVIKAPDDPSPPVDRWAATLAHELRNPLNAVVLALELLHPVCAGHAEAQAAREIAADGSRQMARIIDDVLDLCRGVRRSLSLRWGAVDLASVVASAVRSVDPLLAARRHRLTVSLPPRRTVVEGDAVRIEQVLTNLLTNAAKFTEPGGHVDLVAAPTPAGLVVRVRDDGVGIEPEVLPHVFDLYRQGSAARGRGGLGIGLSLVRSLVELHGGTVTARSDGPGTGAQFTGFLPTCGNRGPGGASRDC